MSTNTTQPPTPSKSGARRTNVLPSGYHLDEYRIDAILGAGGFGVTYKALDTHLDAWVAIKEYFPVEWSFRDADGVMVYANTQGLSSAAGGQTSDYEWGLERFLDEARVLARVQHPYVVRVKRYFRANGTAYIVMEYEEGEPLSTILDDSGTLSEEEVRGLLEDVLPALQAVHEQGYLHRDIKPANLYVRARDHRVMLIDFGAARAAINRHSQSVTSLVTPGYSPPEQYTTRNDRYGTWTDLYALGAVLYRCAIGHTPAEAAERLLDDHLAPAVVAGAGRYSNNLLRAIDRALAVRPEMRFRDVAEMQTALAGPQDEDSDETVIMAPMIKPSKPAQGVTARPVTRYPLAMPPVKVDHGSTWIGTAPPAVAGFQPAERHDHASLSPDVSIENPPSAGRREASPAPLVDERFQSAGRRETSPAPPLVDESLPPRRVPVAVLIGGAVMVMAAALAMVWLWPSAPAPESPSHGLDARGPSPTTAAGHPLPPPVPVTPPLPATPRTETGSTVEAPSGEPVAPSAGVPPPIVTTTTTQRAPASTTESGTSAPGSEPPAPLLEHEGQVVQPVRFQEEPTGAPPAQIQEEPPTEKAPEPIPPGNALPPPTPALVPKEVRTQPGVTTERAAAKPDTSVKASARAVEPVRAKTTRQKERHARTKPTPTHAAPATPARRAAPTATNDPWDAPTSTGFNQK